MVRWHVCVTVLLALPISLRLSGTARAQDEAWSVARVRTILAVPSKAEIEAVRESWLAQLPPVRDAEVVERGSLERDGELFDVLVYRHLVNGDVHYTAVFIPGTTGLERLPVLVETPGVEFNYPTRRITDGPFVMSLLGDLLDDFVIVEPCLRGHELQAIELVHRAAGDRRDSWDGAADDVTAAVSLAVSEIPLADETRVVSIGLSRGGGVSLLHGVRDKRVSAVVAMSAPTDWFRLMARPGDDWPARISRAAVQYDGPANDRSVQFYEWFLQDRAHLSDREIRRRLIASSPLYFAELLPPTLVHQGGRDTSVPSVNAAALGDRFVASGFPIESHRVMVHETAGHLLRGSLAAAQTQQFLRRVLKLPAGEDESEP